MNKFKRFARDVENLYGLPKIHDCFKHGKLHLQIPWLFQLCLNPVLTTLMCNKMQTILCPEAVLNILQSGTSRPSRQALSGSHGVKKAWGARVKMKENATCGSKQTGGQTSLSSFWVTRRKQRNAGVSLFRLFRLDWNTHSHTHVQNGLDNESEASC